MEHYPNARYMLVDGQEEHRAALDAFTAEQSISSCCRPPKRHSHTPVAISRRPGDGGAAMCRIIDKKHKLRYRACSSGTDLYGRREEPPHFVRFYLIWSWKSMDSSEAIVDQMLKSMGFTSVAYEPDGNVPPDFLADSRVAVEVRRLNQNFDAGSGKRGLEEEAIPLWQKVENLAHSLGSATEESWFIFFHFSRPIKPWRQLKLELEVALKNFKSQSVRKNGVVYRESDFELEVTRASKPLEHFFQMGGNSDEQSGGLVVSEMLENIYHCAQEKLDKIGRYQSKYPEWWLVLTDHIGFGLDAYDEGQLLELVKRPAGWDRIIVVSPHHPNRWFAF